MDDNQEPKDERRMNRREVLKLAGFAVTSATLGFSIGNVEAVQKQGSDNTDTNNKGASFSQLFTPLQIGTFTVRNRILSTAHFTGFGKRGLPSERHKNYWSSKARGGIGLIITEVQPVHLTAGIGPSMIQGYRSDVAIAFKPVVEEIHKAGAKIIAQIWHPGKSTLPYSVKDVVSSSAIPSPAYGGRPRALTVGETQELYRSYAQSAYRMREGGLDGVEIHCAHGYLPLQFMSPLQNNRTDDYGGSEENRIRFPMDVIKAVRKEVGDDFTLGIRITGDEFIPGGLTLSGHETHHPEAGGSRESRLRQCQFGRGLCDRSHGHASWGLRLSGRGD